MNKQEYLKSLLSLRKPILTVELSRLINHHLTKLYLYDLNLFDNSIVEMIVNDSLFHNDGEPLSLLEKVLEIIESKPYQPNLTIEYPFWAIESDGVAYYYKYEPQKPNYLPNWITSDFCYIEDENFDSDKYKHMWQDGEWLNSLRKL